MKIITSCFGPNKILDELLIVLFLVSLDIGYLEFIVPNNNSY